MEIVRVPREFLVDALRPGGRDWSSCRQVRPSPVQLDTGLWHLVSGSEA